MEIKFKITYDKKVISEDIPKLSKSDRERIKKAINKKLTTLPEFFGKPLRNSLKGFRKLRIGNYRVIFIIQNDTVVVTYIDHRSTVYKNKRI